jgi:hypothetical protein
MCILINYEKKALVDSKSGKKCKPTCFDDLVAYHAYLLSRGHGKFAQQMLSDVYHDSEKVISKMIKSIQGCN